MEFNICEGFFSLKKFFRTNTWPTAIQRMAMVSMMDHHITRSFRSSARLRPCASRRRWCVWWSSIVVKLRWISCADDSICQVEIVTLYMCNKWIIKLRIQNSYDKETINYEIQQWKEFITIITQYSWNTIMNIYNLWHNEWKIMYRR